MKQFATKKIPSVRRQAAAISLACGAAASKAAAAASVNRSTICRWQQDPEFQAEVTRLSGEIVFSLGRRIASLTGKALDCLESVLDDPSARRGEKIRSASVIVSNYSSLRELAELEFRVQVLEETYGKAKNASR